MTRYVVLNGEYLAKEVQQGSNPAQKYFYHVDLVGSVRAITDSQGQVVARFEYEPFGVTTSASGPLGSRPQAGGEIHKFTGKPEDAATGLYYFHARYYDPVTGGFTSSDPLRQVASPFIYCAQNPFSFTDLTGLWKLQNDGFWLAEKGDTFESLGRLCVYSEGQVDTVRQLHGWSYGRGLHVNDRVLDARVWEGVSKALEESKYGDKGSCETGGWITLEGGHYGSVQAWPTGDEVSIKIQAPLAVIAGKFHVHATKIGQGKVGLGQVTGYEPSEVDLQVHSDYPGVDYVIAPHIGKVYRIEDDRRWTIDPVFSAIVERWDALRKAQQ